MKIPAAALAIGAVICLIAALTVESPLASNALVILAGCSVVGLLVLWGVSAALSEPQPAQPVSQVLPKVEPRA